MNELDVERELFVRYGSAGSEAMFDFPCQIFQDLGCKGFIAYREESKCAIVFGDPICPPDELKKLTKAFHHHCNEAQLNIIYITVSQEFKDLVNDDCKVFFQVTEEIILDPHSNLNTSSHRLEHKMEKAKKHGLSFHEYIPVDNKIEKNLLEIGKEWQGSIKGFHLYLGHLNFFESYIGKRWFYVQDKDKMTSMVMLSKIEAKEGWLLKFLATLPHAFPGTSEFLMLSLLKKLKEENCTFLTKGMLPVDTLEEIEGISPFYQSALKQIYKIISHIFKFHKRKEYWQRYHPQKVPSYLIFHNAKIGFNELNALRKAFRMQ